MMFSAHHRQAKGEHCCSTWTQAGLWVSILDVDWETRMIDGGVFLGIFIQFASPVVTRVVTRRLRTPWLGALVGVLCGLLVAYVGQLRLLEGGPAFCFALVVWPLICGAVGWNSPARDKEKGTQDNNGK